ncbi:probable assembly chaperone of rpl4 isoform X2 [Callorhinchus milii]|uniref:probable assembly chaperone of rpl4 isoform X2 n=1 Tax=Callorhinchus milii TaxID=7868 RepID=UPI001C3FA28C|nr:probable assembly chaperone of rpl4 isoform X2 [Callorhinchus milii]
MAGQSRGRRSRASGFEMAGLSAQDRMRQKMEKKAKKKTEAKYSVQQLLEKAEDCMDNFNFELAQMFCQRALDLEPDNITVLEMMGNIFAELGNSEKAKEVFQRSVELRPEEGHAKYMYLGQIHGGEEAVQYFRKGTELMIREYQKQKELVTQAAACDPDNLEVTSQNISTAFCSVAEIFLTDLCLEEGAADNCKEALEKALEYDPSNPEALQLMASYLFSTEQQQEGKTFLMKSIEQWLPSYQKAVTEQQSQGDDDSEQLQNLFPPYESRITTGKLLIEAEEYEVAVEILEGLLEEDDEVVQVWYLLGWVCYLQAEKSDQEAAFKKSARAHLTKAKKLYTKLKCDDSPLLDHTEQLLADLGGAEGSEPSDDEQPPTEDIQDDFVESSDEEEMEQ